MKDVLSTIDQSNCIFTDRIFFGILRIQFKKAGAAMKVTGIIAEYNPFHNGHLHQIEKIKKETDTDYLITVLSGNFVQRGVPAVVDKFTRTKMALSSGVDLVIELPVLWACASAEYFGAAGVACLDKTGVVNRICFGAECPEAALLSLLAEILLKEPPSYHQVLNSRLKEGLTFPTARMEALLSCLPDSSSFAPEEVRLALSSPNNILAIEYLKELKRRKSSIMPYPILRSGNGYHDTTISPLASAAAIRKLFTHSGQQYPYNIKTLPSDDIQKQLWEAMPKTACQILLDYMKEFPLLHEDNFSLMLKYKLLSQAPYGLADFADCSRDLSSRLCNDLYQFRSFSGFCETLKSKEVTHSRLSRILTHILLDIFQKDLAMGRELDYIPYLRVLGFRQTAAPLLHQIKVKSKLPLLTKMADADRILKEMYAPDSFAHRMLMLDVFAADIYNSVVSELSGKAGKNEFNHGIVIV